LAPKLLDSATEVATDFRSWLVVAFLVFVYVALPNPTTSVTGATTPSVISQQSPTDDEATAPALPAIPADLESLTNEELRTLSYGMSTQLEQLYSEFSRRASTVRYSSDLSAAERGTQLAALDVEFTKLERFAARLQAMSSD